jgi:hypothetical protein
MIVILGIVRAGLRNADGTVFGRSRANLRQA